MASPAFVSSVYLRGGRGLLQPSRLQRSSRRWFARMQSSTSSVSSTRRWYLESGVALFPHPQKVKTGGEDAFFVDETTAGVFDGVGGWARKGVDPGLYARKLAELTKVKLSKETVLVDALDQAHRDNHLKGSCTACILRIDPSGTITVLNVGDSGLLAFRPGKGIFYRSSEQQHFFNCPFQLSSDYQDRAKDGSLEEFAVEPGDYLLLATDGLLDNIHDEDIEFVMKRLHEQSNGKVDLKRIADVLAKRAELLAVDHTYSSPFAVRAREQQQHRMSGGKSDDITVVVCRAVRSSTPASS
eukprot:Plantae.Rhodophyta-Purpureofilum_apyrenoidigerum.ctg23761.p1 GENE.Plantae.Rhodophyta-Purpureofilum_apyrenoidigerum.ctg23761~~Plantae.Rhodophyta-Purpureofilum_apyrenoidigerum.ctg23761.p1  ORF type:complete len:299 (+),score=53.20 Plantae.Rhodophyta-Purpureofilum_apyrenoidigerum.ctg23761:140-1036(+)